MKFNKNQQKVINHMNGNLAVIATAGSGKTTVLTHRIQNLIHNGIIPNSILAVTFSVKARNSIQEKLEALGVSGVQVETFHSFALKIIREKYGNNFTVWTARWEKEKAIKEIMEKYGMPTIDPPFYQMFPYISYHKIRNVSPDNAQVEGITGEMDGAVLQVMYKEYVQYQKENKLLEFDDFMNGANKCLEEDPELLQKYRSRIQYVLADEYQDISESQELLLRKINTTNTMIIGDPLQAIYAFRGGSSRFIMDFDSTYKDVTVVNLNTNYRCSKEIVDISNKLAGAIPDSLHHNYVKPKSHIGKKNPVYLLKSKNQKEEADRIISEMNSEDDVAILARTNAQLQIVQKSLAEHHMSFSIQDGVSFTEQPEIALLLSYLKLSINISDDKAFSVLYNKPLRRLDKKFYEDTTAYAKEHGCSLYEAMQEVRRLQWRFRFGTKEIREVTEYLQNEEFKNVSYMIKYLRKRLAIDRYWAKGQTDDNDGESEKIDNMNAFERMCKDYTTVQDLLQEMDKITAACISDSNIHLLTIHKSKGLEFNTVFVIGFNDGVLPHSRATDIDDEKRLLYVAMTRAKEHLWLSTVGSFNGKTSCISPFYNYIQDNLKVKRRTKHVE